MTFLNFSPKNIKQGLLTLTVLLFTFFANAQPNGSSCIDSNPFCTGSTYNFPNNPAPSSAPSGPNYGCLGSQPKPIWYHMKIDQGGTLKINMKQTTGPNGTGSTLDVDFAMWGPFSDLASGCAQVMSGNLAPLQCSFSASATENIGLGVSGGTGSGSSTPPPAQPGQYYVVLITNYSQQNGYIDFNQTSGTASTNCLIVTPCPLNATISYPALLCTADSNIPVVQTGDPGGTFTSTPPGLTLNPTTGAINPSTSTVGGPYTVTYKVIDPTDATCFATSSAVLNVISGGAPVFTQVAPLCQGGTFALPTTSTNNIVGTWAPAIDNTVTTTYTFTPGPNQCAAVPVTMTVVINPNPVVSAGPDSLICEGTTFIFNGTGANTYTWDNGVTNGVPFTAPDLSATIYTVTGSTAAGCTGTDQMTLSFTPLPTVGFTPDKVTGCLPLEVNFLDDYPNGNAYLWTFGNGMTQTTGPQATTIYNAPGCYDVNLKLTTPNGCVNNLTYPSLICLNPQPVSNFTANPGVLDQLDSYSNMTNLSTGATAYEWNFGDGSPINTLVAPGHEFPNAIAGSYEIVLIAISEEGCRDTSRIIIEVLDELVYYVPNVFTPDGDEFNPTFKPVFTSGFEPLSYRMAIYNRWGEMVFESLNPQFGWDGTYTASEGRVQEGSYTWKIEFKTTLSDARKVIMGHVTLVR